MKMMKTKWNPIKRTISAALCLFVLLMLLSEKLPAQEVKGCCASIYTAESLKQASLKELSSEYKRLNRRPCAECNSWTRSGLFQVMTELGNRLDGKSKTAIRKAMGKADEQEGNKWIYDWRNGHDYLFFEFTDKRAKAQWYFALE